VILIGVVVSLVLHQGALLKQLRQRTILGLADWSYSRKNLHFLLILPEFEFIRLKRLLHAVFTVTWLLSRILRVKVSKNSQLILGNSPLSAKAKAGQEGEICGVGIFGLYMADEILYVVIMDLFEGEVVAVKKLLYTAIDGSIGFGHDMVEILAHILGYSNLHQIVAGSNTF
jgi:hypothetical protein